MSDSGTFLERLKRQGPLEIIYELAKWLLGNAREIAAALVVAITTTLSGIYATLSESEPLITLAAGVFAFGAALWVATQILDFRQRQSGQWGSSWGSSWGKPAIGPTANTRPVEFILPSNWEPGFNRLKFKGTNGAREEREEIRLIVRATEKMENVRLEIEITNFIGSPSSKEIVTSISGDIFSGTVPKGTEEKFLIMRRSYWIASADFNHPEKAVVSQFEI